MFIGSFLGSSVSKKGVFGADCWQRCLAEAIGVFFGGKMNEEVAASLRELHELVSHLTARLDEQGAYCEQVESELAVQRQEVDGLRERVNDLTDQISELSVTEVEADESEEDEEVEEEVTQESQALELDNDGYQQHLLHGQAYVRRPQWAVWRATGEVNGNVYCWRCGKSGHIQRFCRAL